MNLYYVKTRKYSHYVLAEHPTQAQEKLEELLRIADHGFYDDRKVIEIKLIAIELTEFPEGKPNFSSRNNLIL
jgi:hypothetical protein